MRILGTFRDLDDPDQFVWLRGFADLASRAPALEAFYTGSIWARPVSRRTRRWWTSTTSCSCGPPRSARPSRSTRRGIPRLARLNATQRSQR